jgi:hypothetical protein
MTKIATRPPTAAELVYITQCHVAQNEGIDETRVKFIDYADLPPPRRRECEAVEAVLFQVHLKRIMAEVMRGADWIDDFHKDEKRTARVSMQKVANWLMLPPPAQEKRP